MPNELPIDTWKVALPLSTFLMAFASALFGFLSWRAEGMRRRAEARRLRLEATIEDLAQLFAAIPHDRARWSEAFTQQFVEKVCKVDFRIDEENPHAQKLVTSIQDMLPRDAVNRDVDHMTNYNRARTIAKEYLDVEWKKFKTETGTRN